MKQNAKAVPHHLMMMFLTIAQQYDECTKAKKHSQVFDNVSPPASTQTSIKLSLHSTSAYQTSSQRWTKITIWPKIYFH